VLAWPEGWGHGCGASCATLGNRSAASWGLRQGSSPERLALVVARGPLARSRSKARSQAGTRRPMLSPPGCRGSTSSGAAGTTSVSAPGQY
jgi:hypothetical protein